MDRDGAKRAPSADWWKRGVLYHVYPRSFADADGDGVGDLRGVASRLDHLAGGPDSLGVAGIWLSPFYPSPMVDGGYDVSDYRDVHPALGSLADFDALLEAAHARGVRVLIDLVPNHTSDRHPWFQESRRGRGDPRRDWYVWADGGPGGRPPNNWLSAFAPVGSAWTLDQATGQWYLHSFAPEQPDLNWWNPEVRAAIDQVMRFWLRRGVDGFRLDVVNRLTKDPELRDNPPEVAALRKDETVHQLQLRNNDWPETHAVLRGFRRTLDEFGAVSLGEVAIVDLGRALRYYGAGDELHLVLNFKFWLQPWAAGAFRSVVAEVEAGLPSGGWPVYALSNHDISRTVNRYGGAERGRLAALLLLTLRGTPVVYYGEEIGMADRPAVPGSDFEGRDRARAPMPWAEVEAQGRDPRSMLSLWRRLVALRRGCEALQSGSYRPVAVDAPDLFAFERVAGAERLLVALNFGGDPAPLGSQSGSARRLLSTRLDLPPASVRLDGYELRPLEGSVFRLG
jgi:alpha-glucosidase